MGAMDVECGRCHALFWQEEHNFMSCCKQGEIVLPPVRELPDLLRRLLTRDHPTSDSFFKNIRQYNSALAFTVIVLAESKAVRDGGLRPIRDRGGTPRTHVTAGGSHILAVRNLKASRYGRIP
jgi:hypothetical protein